MSPRTLFIIILRVLGILSIKGLLTSIPQLLVILSSFFGGYSVSDSVFMLVISVIAVALDLTVFYFLVFRAEWIVEKLKLEQGILESPLQLNISMSSICGLAIIITGFFLLVTEIPELARFIYKRFQESNITFLQTSSRDWSPAVISVVKIILAFLIIGERQRIVSFLERSPGPQADK